MARYRVEWREKGPNEKEHVFETNNKEEFDDFVFDGLFEDLYAYDVDYVFIYAADPPKKKKK